MASLIKLLARRHFYPNLVKTGISKSIANFSKHQFLILNYHGVIDKVDFKIFPGSEKKELEIIQNITFT